MTRSKIELGRMLFFEKRISADGKVACSSCHIPQRGFSNGRQYGIGIGGRIGLRNTPTIINAAFNERQFWDGRANSLEEQAKGPIQHPAEMGSSEEHIIRVLGASQDYRTAFLKAFGSEKITLDLVAKAIATFERTILSGGSPFDRWKYNGEKNAISASAKRGFKIFQTKGKCQKCHLLDEFSAPFTDNKFHNIGIGMQTKPPHIGREKVTKSIRDRGKFKTPTLREISRTAPYMHDGSMNTLEEVIDYYDKGAVGNLYLDPDIKPLNLTRDEKRDLIAFLHTLNGKLPEITGPGKIP